LVTEQELERLRTQARLINPITRQFFAEAGIAPGMRVLDVGSGPGEVAFVSAELVGTSGQIVGVDRSATLLAMARARASERSLGNVTFHEGDPAEMTFEDPFDDTYTIGAQGRNSPLF
jgi:ubiquinone/menaquinone biosynthesis C-methylase UbiE